MKLFLITMLAATTCCTAQAQDLQLNDRDYFERQGVNILVYSNNFNGGFNDEKNSGIEIIHHGVRTVQGPGPIFVDCHAEASPPYVPITNL